MTKKLQNRSQLVSHLEERIEQANAAYWIKNDPIISDFEYDTLVEKLRNLDPSNPLVSSLKGSSDEIQNRKIRHEKAMLSLAKAYTIQEVIAWANKVARSPSELFDVQPKLDGCSAEFIGSRRQISTRGDGVVGSDVSHIAPFVEWSNPDAPNRERSVGELLIPLDKFDRYKETIPEFADYKTPRNAITGLLALLPEQFLSITREHPDFRVWFYEHSQCYTDPIPVTTENISTVESVSEMISKIAPVPMDGIVFKLHDQEYAESLGATEHHPRGAIAWKFVDEMFSTTVTSIDWQVGNEAITPVANFNTVIVDGVKVKRATMHNAKFVVDNNVTDGCGVDVVRRGGVIPKIVGVSPIVGKIASIPKVCPSCGQQLEWGGPDLVCKNPECVGRIVNKITKGLQALDMKGVGPKLVEKLVSELSIQNIMTWFQEVYDRELLKAKGLTAFEIGVLMSEFERVTTKGVDDEKLLASLCIPQVGESFGKLVIKYSGSIMTLAEDAEQAMNKLSSIPRINSTALINAIDFVSENAAEFMVYYNLFKHNQPLTEDRQKFCFTGPLPNTRKEVEQWVIEHGGYPTENIRQANYLVTMNPMSSSSKMVYARAHNVPIINFTELKNLLGSSGR